MFIIAKVVATAIVAGMMSSDPVISDMPHKITSSYDLDDANADRCAVIPSPPARLQTNSKYSQDFGSRSVVDETTYQKRLQALSSTEKSIRNLQILVLPLAGEVQLNSTQCAVKNLDSWARGGALTDMRTDDANLSRDRLMASITEVIIILGSRQPGLASQPAIRGWLVSVAKNTMDYYGFRAGATSRRNNHRYWAGLSVGRIGYFLNESRMLTWASESLDIGLCQIDVEGFLPLELARAEKALDYHLYAYIERRASLWTHKVRSTSLNLRIVLSENRFRFSGRCCSSTIAR